MTDNPIQQDNGIEDNAQQEQEFILENSVRADDVYQKLLAHLERSKDKPFRHSAIFTTNRKCDVETSSEFMPKYKVGRVGHSPEGISIMNGTNRKPCYINGRLVTSNDLKGCFLYFTGKGKWSSSFCDTRYETAIEKVLKRKNEFYFLDLYCKAPLIGCLSKEVAENTTLEKLNKERKIHRVVIFACERDSIQHEFCKRYFKKLTKDDKFFTVRKVGGSEKRLTIFGSDQYHYKIFTFVDMKKNDFIVVDDAKPRDKGFDIWNDSNFHCSICCPSYD